MVPSRFSAKVQIDQHRRDLRFCHELAKRLGCPLLTARLPCGTGEFRYRCFLPDLTGFAAPSCTGPNYQQSTSNFRNSVGPNAPVFTARLLLPSPAFFQVAERGGFEPPVLFWSTHDFQTCTRQSLNQNRAKFKGKFDSALPYRLFLSVYHCLCDLYKSWTIFPRRNDLFAPIVCQETRSPPLNLELKKGVEMSGMSFKKGNREASRRAKLERKQEKRNERKQAATADKAEQSKGNHHAEL